MFLNPSLLVRAANTTFNAAAESSPMLQCNDIRHCRTLQSIIYGCFSTVFLCTWTALHLDLSSSPLLKRVGWMVTATIAPELVFMAAFYDWTNSSDLLEKILKIYPKCGWTETHAQFVRMGGFRLVDAEGKRFIACIKDGTIDLPKVSKKDILGRSKGDLIAKSFAVIQTAWFVFQCIHRRSQHLLLTELEITTLAHTLINFFIYFFWWHKPYGVAVPIEVPFKERRPETIAGRDDKVESKGGSSNASDNIQVPQTTEIGENLTEPPPISNDDPSITSEKGVPVATKSSDDKSPAAAAEKELIFDVEASNGTPSPQLSWYTRLGIKTSSVSKPEQLSIPGRILLSTIWIIVGGGFGAMHCLAWNSAFPTRAEQVIWQVSSLIVTVFGGTTLLMAISDMDIWELAGCTFIIIIPMYCFARISLLVLALLQLRALPYAGYETPSWTIFYPHIG
ncbi:hypothetical protein M378DRAFT_12853 [Amanita muscaria Koide BX008]|uniref:Uncharacterized protein n=1 Tax=Amanita muscaria (strain Koide BX008) TaxID=946122 RepID=A0A0C2WLC7_AMAMK|nr:hypothetical protein M378DRAFT_12853 [Amanita muscaria Koide BX008]